MQSDRFYVYAHRRHDTGDVFYVGKGTGKRAWVKSGRNSLWSRTAKKHGFDVEIIHRYLTEQEAFALEREEIERLCPTCNFTDGGEGISGYHHTDATKEAIRSAHVGRPQPRELVERRAEKLRGKKRTAEFGASVSERNRGRIASQETRQKMSETRKGRTLSPETIAKCVKAHLGAKRSRESRQRMSDAQRKKAIICQETGLTFPSLTSAAEWVRKSGISKASKTGIWLSATGKHRKSYGFHWSYSDTSNAEPSAS